MTISATVEVCDDLRFEKDNKMTVVGVYNTDIGIIPGPNPVLKLIFLFHIDGDRETVPSDLFVQVGIGSKEPRRQAVEIPAYVKEKTKAHWRLRGVVVFHNEIIEPGEVDAKVIVDGEAYDVASPNFVKREPPAGPLTGS